MRRFIHLNTLTALLRPALVGLLAAAAGIAVAQLVAAATHPAAGPLAAVGETMIDATPTPLKEFAVRNFGTNDKTVLLAGISLVLALIAAALGILGSRRRPFAIVGAALFAAVGTVAALTRPAGTPLDALPSLAGGLITAVAFLLLLRRLNPTEDEEAPPARRMRVFDRRTFLGTASLVAAGTAVVGAGAYELGNVRGGAATRTREAVKLPAPADPAKPLPAGTPPDFHTANADFYRVDTALTVPRVDLAGWRLKIHGMVDKQLDLSFEDLLKRRLIERDITLNCVSNEVGGPYIGTARWLGVPLAPLLREAGIQSAADQIVARSVDGMTIGTPTMTAMDGRDTMLCVGMNGEPLPFEHGFPVRMLTPGLYGYVGACKWIQEIELSTFASFDAYWVKRKWSAEAPVKTASRIDKPASFAQLKPGPVSVAGVAWAQHRGIRKVEIQVDDGPWAEATLLPVPSVDTWVQWRYTWTASGDGPHILRVRATDGTGATQTDQRVEPFPNGATGWHTVSVNVT